AGASVHGCAKTLLALEWHAVERASRRAHAHRVEPGDVGRELTGESSGIGLRHGERESGPIRTRDFRPTEGAMIDRHIVFRQRRNDRYAGARIKSALRRPG